MDVPHVREQVGADLAYITGLVNQKLPLQNEYLAAGNRILRGRLPARIRLSDAERSTLAEIGKLLGRAGQWVGGNDAWGRVSRRDRPTPYSLPIAIVNVGVTRPGHKWPVISDLSWIEPRRSQFRWPNFW